jgi:hypothetical protein
MTEKHLRLLSELLDDFRRYKEGQSGPIVWETEDGRKLRMADITDSHMMKIIGFLERKRAAVIVRNNHAKKSLSDEDLIDYEDACDDKGEVAAYEEKINSFLNELDRRREKQIEAREKESFVRDYADNIPQEMYSEPEYSKFFNSGKKSPK